MLEFSSWGGGIRGASGANGVRDGGQSEGDRERSTELQDDMRILPNITAIVGGCTL